MDPNNNDADYIDGRNPLFDYLLIENRTFYSAQLYYQPENKVIIQAANTIETNGDVIITSGSDYEFVAGESIILGQGFHAEAGCKFVASINPSLKVIQNKADTLTINKIDLKNIYDVTPQLIINAYPNPFTEKITIEYSLPETTNVDILIYDIYGNCISQILTNEYHDKGIYQIDLEDNIIHAGIYFCIIKTNSTSNCTKIIKIN